MRGFQARVVQCFEQVTIVCARMSPSQASSAEKKGKEPAAPTVLPNELGMVQGVNHQEVVEACQSGDDDAFRVLFETHKDRVYSIALRYAGDSAAMDIAQDTF